MFVDALDFVDDQNIQTLNFADIASERGFDAMGNALSFADTANDRSLNVIDDVINFAKDANNKALAFANNASKSDEDQGLEKIAGYIPLMVVVGGVAYMFKK